MFLFERRRKKFEGVGEAEEVPLDVFGEGISVNQALASLHPYYYSRSFLLLLLLLLVVMLVVVVVGGGKSGEGGGVVLDQPRKGHVRRSVETSRKLCLRYTPQWAPGNTDGTNARIVGND
jgi:hypothetical protein